MQTVRIHAHIHIPMSIFIVGHSNESRHDSTHRINKVIGRVGVAHTCIHMHKREAVLRSTWLFVYYKPFFQFTQTHSLQSDKKKFNEKLLSFFGVIILRIVPYSRRSWPSL